MQEKFYQYDSSLRLNLSFTNYSNFQNTKKQSMSYARGQFCIGCLGKIPGTRMKNGFAKNSWIYLNGLSIKISQTIKTATNLETSSLASSTLYTPLFPVIFSLLIYIYIYPHTQHESGNLLNSSLTNISSWLTFFHLTGVMWMSRQWLNHTWIMF